MDIVIFEAAHMRKHLARLATILKEAVEHGAVIGFVRPFQVDQAEAYWQGVYGSVADGERLLLCAVSDGDIIGTVQLYLSPEPNAPHRAEVFKLLVDPAFRGKGVGSALMLAVEDEASRRKRTLLLLDTVAGGSAERLYRRLGWREIGVVPNHFVDPDGNPRSSIYFMRDLGR